MSQCGCENGGAIAGVGCGCGERQVTDLCTPLYQAIGGTLYRLHVRTKAKYIETGEGGDVETRINSIERILGTNTTTRFADTIAGRDALVGLVPGDWCHVRDASADPKVRKGPATYLWLPALQWRLMYKGLSPLDAINMIAPDGGLKVNEYGRIYVDLADIPEEQRRAILASLVASGKGLELNADGKLVFNPENLIGKNGGLVVGDDGKVYVDFSGVPSSTKTVIIRDLIREIIRSGGAIVIGADGCLDLDLTKIAGAGLKVAAGKLTVDAAKLAEVLGGIFNVGSDGSVTINAAALAGPGLRVENSRLAAKVGAGLKVSQAAGIELDLGNAGSAATWASLIAAGGGLAVDANGRIYVDFSLMPETKFRKLLKDLRLPFWLEKNTTFYVRKAGNDVIVENKGTTEALAFATIQACVDYVCANFNLSKYNVTIDVGPGAFEESLNLGGYQATTGRVYIRGAESSGADPTTIVKTTDAALMTVTGPRYDVSNVTLWQVVTANLPRFTSGVNVATNAILSLGRFSMKVDYQNAAANAHHRPFTAGGLLYLSNGSAIASKITISNYSQGMDAVFVCNGDIQMLGAQTGAEDIICSGACSVFMSVNGGYFSRNTGYSPVIGFAGSMTGKRYAVTNGGRVNTAGLKTVDGVSQYFPGDVTPTSADVEASTYSWYK